MAFRLQPALLVEFESFAASHQHQIGPINFSEIRFTMAAIIEMVTQAKSFVPARSVSLSCPMLWPGSELGEAYFTEPYPIPETKS